MAKLDRRNQAKQRQLIKHREHQNETSIFSGRDGAPRIVAVIPLCSDCDALAAVRNLMQSVDIEDDAWITPDNDNGSTTTGSQFRVVVDRFKQRLQFIPVQRGDLTASLDAARVADYVVTVLSATVEVDQLGELTIRGVESQGMSTLFTVVQGLESVEGGHKQRSQVLGSLRSFMTHFHAGQDKLYSLDSRQECSNLVRSLCCSTPQGFRWREDRSWMLVEKVRWPEGGDEGMTVVTGVVRGRGLNADRLVHVGDWGTFQVEKITAAPLSQRRKKGGEIPAEEGEQILHMPTEDRDDLAYLAPEEAVMEDAKDADMTASVATSTRKGVLLDDHRYFSDEEEEEFEPPKKLPKGTSSINAAWMLDYEGSDSGSDVDDDEMRDVAGVQEEAGPEDGFEGFADAEMTEAGPSEYPQSEAMIEPDEEDDAEQLAQFRARKRDEAREDMEFPDEIELHPTVLARERLAKYRGLKSLRTSPWNEEEDAPYQPENWARLLQISNYAASKSRHINEALVGGVKPGTRVHVYLKDVPSTARDSYDQSKPLTLFSLLRHEHKWTVVNYLINLPSDYPESIKSKEELVVQCGFRRFVIRPLFSQSGNTENDVHKYCRFLHPGQSAIATFMGPVTWGSVPLVFYKRAAEGEATAHKETELPLAMVAAGTSLPPSTSRIITKRVILTGHPYHIHKKVVTVRYMFFNREDVSWFKALPLWTKRGRRGYIKEPLGTHGYFKATFDGKINPQDSVAVSLYKRVWPRPSSLLTTSLLDIRGKGKARDHAMED